MVRMNYRKRENEEDEDVDRRGVVRDGGRARVPVTLMDAAQSCVVSRTRLAPASAGPRDAQ